MSEPTLKDKLLKLADKLAQNEAQVYAIRGLPEPNSEHIREMLSLLEEARVWVDHWYPNPRDPDSLQCEPDCPRCRLDRALGEK